MTIIEMMLSIEEKYQEKTNLEIQSEYKRVNEEKEAAAIVKK
jgi:hypothetical protein